MQRVTIGYASMALMLVVSLLLLPQANIGLAQDLPTPTPTPETDMEGAGEVVEEAPAYVESEIFPQVTEAVEQATGETVTFNHRATQEQTGNYISFSAETTPELSTGTYGFAYGFTQETINRYGNFTESSNAVTQALMLRTLAIRSAMIKDALDRGQNPNDPEIIPSFNELYAQVEAGNIPEFSVMVDAAVLGERRHLDGRTELELKNVEFTSDSPIMFVTMENYELVSEFLDATVEAINGELVFFRMNNLQSSFMLCIERDSQPNIFVFISAVNPNETSTRSKESTLERSNAANLVTRGFGASSEYQGQSFPPPGTSQETTYSDNGLREIMMNLIQSSAGNTIVNIQ